MDHKSNAAVRAYNISEGHEQCLSCGEYITHPICPCCITRGFKQWLLEYPQIYKHTTTKLNLFLQKTKTLKGARCVRCNSYKVHTCPYCFTEHLHQLIKEAGAGVRIMSQFLFMFNFDFEKKGYAKELEIYGGY